MSYLLDDDYMQDANDAIASGNASVYRDKHNPNDARNVEWNLGGKWIERIPAYRYDVARNGCGNPIHFKGKNVYYKMHGTMSPSSISLEDMAKKMVGKKYVNGWMELEHFYVVDERARETKPFLSLCQIGLN